MTDLSSSAAPFAGRPTIGSSAAPHWRLAMARPTLRSAAVAVAVLTGIALALPVVLEHGTPQARAAQPGSITLHAESARTVGTAPGQVRKGDAITEYRWLIAAEDVGNPRDSLQNCLPARAGG